MKFLAMLALCLFAVPFVSDAIATPLTDETVLASGTTTVITDFDATISWAEVEAQGADVRVAFLNATDVQTWPHADSPVTDGFMVRNGKSRVFIDIGLATKVRVTRPDGAAEVVVSISRNRDQP